jgi:hypothetical protein
MSGISMSGAFGGDILQMILQAGMVVKFVLFVLVFFSVTSWAIIFMKWRVLRRANDENAYFLDLFWENTAFTKLYAESEELSFSPVAQLFRAGYAEINRFAKFQNPGGGKESEAARHSLMDVVERTLRKNRYRSVQQAGAGHLFSGHDRQHRPFCRAFRNGLGHHGVLQRHRADGCSQPRGGCTRYIRSPCCYSGRPCGCDSGGYRLQLFQQQGHPAQVRNGSLHG